MKKLFIVFMLFAVYAISAHAQEGHKGTVISAQNVDRYTYMEINKSGKKIWIASPQIDVKAGDTVEASAGNLMTNFNSPSLKKTFDEIYFVTHIKIVQPAGEKKQPAAGKKSAKTKKPVPLTVAGLIENRAKLKDKEVTVTGKVTRATKGIMQKNWIHITDIKPSEKPADLTITTTDDAAVGDAITVTGKLAVDKDFGMGYFFAQIIEDAKIIPAKK